LEYFNEPANYFKLVCDPSNEILSVRIIGEELTAVTYKKTDGFVETLPHTNSVIAAYTTAQARLKLYSYIEQLERRVLYFDTGKFLGCTLCIYIRIILDSVIYLTRPDDQYNPSIGDFLGELTDELSEYGVGSYIDEFVSGELILHLLYLKNLYTILAGPKQYGLKIWSTKEKKFVKVVKIRGFTINSTTGNQLNFKNLKQMVKLYLKSGVKDTMDIVMKKIERTADHKVVTKTMKKTYTVVFDKRVVLSTGDTLPFGY
jgi:hypothetical protein